MFSCLSENYKGSTCVIRRSLSCSNTLLLALRPLLQKFWRLFQTKGQFFSCHCQCHFLLCHFTSFLVCHDNCLFSSDLFFCLLALTLTLPWRMHVVQALLVHSWNQHGWSYSPSHWSIGALLVLHLQQMLQTCLNLKDLSSEGWSFTIRKVVCFLTKKSNSNNRAYAWPGISFNVMRPFGFILLHIHSPWL